MSIIEQAARRLEELRRAGIDLPEHPAGSDAATADAADGPAAVGASTDGTPAPAAAAQPAPAPRPGERPARQVTLDFDRLEREGLLTPRLVDRSLAEEMRIIKLELLRNVAVANEQGLRGNLILVTSSVPGEGKTFFAVNLAMSLAMEVDHHVMLVDADVLRPSVLARLGLEESAGLLDLASRPELDVSEVLLRAMPKLTLLPTGTLNHLAPELLSSAYMDRLLAELADRYPDRIIIFDAPPVLVTSGARHLATRVGQVVMVVRADSTDSRQVSRGFSAVDACPLVHTVLNQCETAVTDYGYYDT